MFFYTPPPLSHSELKVLGSTWQRSSAAHRLRARINYSRMEETLTRILINLDQSDCDRVDGLFNSLPCRCRWWTLAARIPVRATDISTIPLRRRRVPAITELTHTRSALQLHFVQRRSRYRSVGHSIRTSSRQRPDATRLPLSHPSIRLASPLT